MQMILENATNTMYKTNKACFVNRDIFYLCVRLYDPKP